MLVSIRPLFDICVQMDEILSANQPQMDRVCDKVKKLLIKKQKLKQDPLIEVTPRLILGNYCSAIDKALLQSKQIKLVVSCVKVEDRDRCQQVQYLQILVKDQADEKISKYFDQLYHKLSAYLDAGKACLVNCFSAKSRSPTLVLSYLIRKGSMDYQSAHKLLKQKAPNIQPNKGFISQLKQYSSRYKKQQKFADIRQQGHQHSNAVMDDVSQQSKQIVNMKKNSENELAKESSQKQQKLQQQKIEIDQIEQQQVQEDNNEKQDLPNNLEEGRSNTQQKLQLKQQDTSKGQPVVTNQTNLQNSQVKQQPSHHTNMISSSHIEEVDAQNQNTVTQQSAINIAPLEIVASDMVEPTPNNQQQQMQQQSAVGKQKQQIQLTQVYAQEQIAVEVHKSTEGALNTPMGAQQPHQQQKQKNQDRKRQEIIAEQKIESVENASPQGQQVTSETICEMKQEKNVEVEVEHEHEHEHEHEGKHEKQEQHLVEGEGEVRKKKKKKKKNK